MLYSRSFQGVSIGQSASFTWDGEVIVFGHEPGGGGQAQCQESSSDVNRTLFFLDAASGDTVGTFISPCPQTEFENCTWHNCNVVPTDESYVLVSGKYQSDIRRGLVWKLSDRAVAGAKKFDELNPQTQEVSFPFKGRAGG